MQLEEYLPLTVEAGFLIMIHHPWAEEDITQDVTFVAPGSATFISVLMVSRLFVLFCFSASGVSFTVCLQRLDQDHGIFGPSSQYGLREGDEGVDHLQALSSFCPLPSSRRDYATHVHLRLIFAGGVCHEIVNDLHVLYI